MSARVEMLRRGARALVDNWWLFLLRGLLAIAFGLLTMWRPFSALTALVLLFGAYAFVDGVYALFLGLRGWRSWSLALVGLVGIAVGLLTFFRPGITAIGLYLAIAVWSVTHGILEIVTAIELRKEIEGEVFLILAGLASIAFGVLMVALPMAGVMALAWLISFWAIAFGFILCALAFRLRSARTTTRPSVHERAPTLQPG